MKIHSGEKAVTAMGASSADTIIVRGHDLVDDLVGKVSLTQHLWLLVTGELPSPEQTKILDSALVAIAEHGLVPSVVAARMTLAASPEAIQGAVAAGLLGCGSVVLGSSQYAGEFLNEIVVAAETRDFEDATAGVVAHYRAQKRAIPGYGHSLHRGGDPRALRLFEIARGAGLFGKHCEAAHRIESLLPGLINRSLHMNISAAIPATLLDAGYPVAALKGVPLVARAAGLIGHLLEEQQSPIGFTLGHAASSAIEYSGELPDGFVVEHV